MIALADQNVWTIGRGPENDITLNEHTVSRNHAQLQHQGLGEYVVTDVGSGNGSFVNGKRIEAAHSLQHGDLITIGRIQLEFQGGNSDDALLFPKRPQRTVLMLQTSALQGKVWQEVLASQKVTAVHLSPTTDLAQLLTQRATEDILPDLLLLDMTGLQDNPYHFCRWCRDTYPQVKVMLMSGKRADISASERKWAVHQGAVDLLPGFSEAQLFNNLLEVTARVKRVLEAIDWPEVEQQALLEALLSIQALRTGK